MSNKKVIISGCKKKEQLFFGATPERLIEISDGRAYSACVAGSIKRGKTAEEDRALGEELLEDSKNREEHHYVVNMISKVFNKYCTDSIDVEEAEVDENPGYSTSIYTD